MTGSQNEIKRNQLQINIMIIDRLKAYINGFDERNWRADFNTGSVRFAVVVLAEIQLTFLTLSLGLGTALGPLSLGVLIWYGFLASVAIGIVLAVVGVILSPTRGEKTITDENVNRWNVSEQASTVGGGSDE